MNFWRSMIETIENEGVPAPVFFARVALFFLFAAVVGGAWDIWWHIMEGRDTFFEPPHMLIYGGIIVAVIASILAYRHGHDRAARNAAIVLSLIPLFVGPFDELWHQMFGVERIDSVWIIWSPPHIALVGFIIASFFFLLPLLRNDREEVRRFFTILAGAGTLFLVGFLAIPFKPEGQFHILEWWGSGVRLFMVGFALTYFARRAGGFFPALQIAIWYGMLLGIMAEVGVRNPDIVMKPVIDYPVWVVIFAHLLFALVVDLWRALERPAVNTGIIAGFLFAFALYYGGLFFVPVPDDLYMLGDIAIAIFSAVLGGALAVVFAEALVKRG